MENKTENPRRSVFRRSLAPLFTDIIFVEVATLFVFIALTVLAGIFNVGIFLIVGVIFFFFLNIFLAVRYYNWTHSEYVITQSSVAFIRNHLFAKQEDLFTINENADIKLRQNLFGRVFNHGTVVITGPTVDGEILLSYIDSPEAALKELVDMVSKIERSAVFLEDS